VIRPLRGLRRPSPAIVISCVALAVALSGTSYAVTALPRNSVGTAHLKNGAVNSAKVRDGAIRLADIVPADRSTAHHGSVGDLGSVPLPADHSFVELVKYTLPPGRYVAIATVQASRNAGPGDTAEAVVQCSLELGTGFGGGLETIDGPFGAVNLSPSLAVTIAAPSNVTLSCNSNGAGSGLSVERANLHALKVGSLVKH
jgi:hypothetical protein